LPSSSRQKHPITNLRITPPGAAVAAAPAAEFKPQEEVDFGKISITEALSLLNVSEWIQGVDRGCRILKEEV